MDSDLEEIQERLFYGSPKLEIVSVVGMGGIGKTTLARCIYSDINSNRHFDICMWVTISQQRGLLRVLRDLLASAELLTDEMKKESDDGVIGDYLYKALIGRRYLVVMDDVWDIEIWDAVRRSFPDDNNGSRVLLTTRLAEVVRYTSPCSAPHRMQFLNQEEGWHLLCDRVFGGESCPHELREIGDEIVDNCRGLPLAIVVTGGLLSTIDRTKENWRNFADSLRSTSTKDDDECMEILALSYDHLPHHLRPCFLYMGMFPEDYVIPVNKLAWLWAAEGFLQSESCKSPEELAEEYLQDLVERSLILVHIRGSQGKIKTCMMHDVLRNLCQHQACKEKFLYVANDHSDVLSEGREPCCRLSIHPNALKAHPDILFDDELLNSRAHSLLCIGTYHTPLQHGYLRYRLRRVLDLLAIHFSDFPLETLSLVCLRYLALAFTGRLDHPDICKLQNLQTLVHSDIVSHRDFILPVEIWKLPRLRHLIVPSYHLANPTRWSLTSVHQSLQTLEKVTNLAFGFEILKQLNSLKKLSVSYVSLTSPTGWWKHKLENIVHLNQLEKLTLWVHDGSPWDLYMPNLALPHSLKKLTLGGCRSSWELMRRVGALPDLEVLKLKTNACIGAKWEPVEGQFRNLKYLLLQHMDELVQWAADETHFPHLRHLVINSCHGLNEIPLSIGDIDTLERIGLVDCHPSIVKSAKKIREEQRDMGGSGLNLRVYCTREFQERMWR